ncbi:hypothetical protein R1sor_023724 [Riccia sorocarpa]|uniref:Uncharacterized protein n=1 Tax=Riccia sorocarpa TaxID=122646 RepID=A0ABD3GP87_9MARC
MEAIAVSSKGVMAVCRSRPAAVTGGTSRRGNLALPMDRSFSSGTTLRTSSATADFQDQSHVHFYLNVRCSRKEKINRRKPMAAHGSGTIDFMGRAEEGNGRKKIHKLKGERRLDTSSSSSSSSESDSSEDEMVDTTTEARENFQVVDKVEIRRGRKFDVQKFKKDWEELSRSELMNSIPRFTADFQIEPPLTTTIEHLQKSYDLPAGRHPPSMAVDCAVQLPSSRDGPSDVTSASDSLVTVAGIAVVEDDLWSEADLQPPTAHVEVCMGGKCKKAGAGEVLNAFQVAGRPGVTASPCKCLKNCKSAVSIRIEDQEGSKQVYTGVGLQDVDVLLQKHCSTGSAGASRTAFDLRPPFGSEPQQLRRDGRC